MGGKLPPRRLRYLPYSDVLRTLIFVISNPCVEGQMLVLRMAHASMKIHRYLFGILSNCAFESKVVAILLGESTLRDRGKPYSRGFIAR